jgi:hypothetical protein
MFSRFFLLLARRANSIDAIIQMPRLATACLAGRNRYVSREFYKLKTTRYCKTCYEDAVCFGISGKRYADTLRFSKGDEEA